MAWRIGVDTGGTFTDVCLYNEETRAVSVAKVSSTPSDPGQAVLAGMRAALGVTEVNAQNEFAKINYFAHGTTVATNTLLQMDGAKVALLTTKGFRDLLELGRQRRPKLYDLHAQKPTPLVPRNLRFEIEERVTFDGAVAIAANVEEIREQVRKLKELDIDAVSVCFLYSYLRPEHEALVRQVLDEELPGVFLSISNEVLPEFREFERLSTTVINAFIGPTMANYLGRLRESLEAEGLGTVPKVTQSNGGVLSFRLAEKLPVRTVLSGPSAGVVGAARLAKQSGIDNIITFDVGGTSSDVALVREGRPTAANGMVLDGRPVQAPMLDINTVGAGGGSIAWVDDGGHLKVGPQSAGAFPGPACYNLGNEEPTVTDANVVLGTLNQTHLLAGQMPIDAEKSFAAVKRLGDELGMDVVDTAQGIISVVTANMAKAIRVISVQRGYDPADYALVAFGGGGPLHSSRLAAELGMQSTLIPHNPGAMSAVGMLMTDLRADYTRTVRVPLKEEYLVTYIDAFEALSAEADMWFAEEKLPESKRRLHKVLDVRYVGQNYELGIDVPEGEIDTAWFESVHKSFNDAHHVRYGYANPNEAIEAVTFKIEAIGEVPQVEFPAHEASVLPVSEAIVGCRKVYFPESGGYVDCPVFDRQKLGVGHLVLGPAIIEQYDTTTVVLPGTCARVDNYLLIIIEPTNS